LFSSVPPRRSARFELAFNMKNVSAYSLFCFVVVRCVLGVENLPVHGNSGSNHRHKNGAEIITMITGDSTGISWNENCNSSSTCSFPFVCIPLFGDEKCYYKPCSSDSDCGKGTQCNNYSVCDVYSCDQDSDCKMNDFVCRTFGGNAGDGSGSYYFQACVPDPDPCSKCGSGETCNNGKCEKKPDACSKCKGDEVCRNGKCVSEEPGSEEATEPGGDSGSKLPLAGIIGGAVSAIVLITICCGVFLFMRNKKKKVSFVEENATTGGGSRLVF